MKRIDKTPDDGDRGSFSIEASFVIPPVIVLVSLMLTFNMYFVSKFDSYEKYQRDDPKDCCDLHRGISAVFDAGGNIYETLFG